jgi:hypothetical protein
MKNKPLINQAELVDKYLYNLGMAIGRLCQDKDIPKKDKKWIKECVLSIIQIKDLLCVVKAAKIFNNRRLNDANDKNKAKRIKCKKMYY